jgi:hypothetical protein
MPRMIAPRTGAPEITLAENHPEYSPVTVAVYGDNRKLGPRTLLSRWTFTDEERARIAAGEDVFLGVITFGRPMQPVSLQVGPEGWAAPPPAAKERP